MIQVGRRNARGSQAILNGQGGKPGAMFFAIKPFFLNGRNQFSVFGEGRGGIAVICIDPKDVQKRKLLAPGGLSSILFEGARQGKETR
ncbi:MAG: hypothetical protein AB7O65_13525, partial [Candidatus Korobacteraceae bacterium]